MRLIYLLPLAVLLVLVAACDEPSEAQRIVDRAIEAHGVDVLDDAEATFTFRDAQFRLHRAADRFRYERRYTDSTGAAVREVLTNDSLYRAVDGRRLSLPDSVLRGVETTVNSVVYFAFLPYRLNDPAVEKRYLGRDTLRGQPYDAVEVTFEQQGGGRDWEDRFVYWFHPQQHTLDYLAYHFHTDGGGTRFREAVDPRTVDGVLVNDYVNYTAADSIGTQIERYPELLAQDRLERVSAVRLEDVQVRPLD